MSSMIHTDQADQISRVHVSGGKDTSTHLWPCKVLRTARQQVLAQLQAAPQACCLEGSKGCCTVLLPSPHVSRNATSWGADGKTASSSFLSLGLGHQPAAHACVIHH